MSKHKSHRANLELRDFFGIGSYIMLNLDDGEKEYRVIRSEPEGLTVLTDSGRVEIPNGDSRIVLE